MYFFRVVFYVKPFTVQTSKKSLHSSQQVRQSDQAPCCWDSKGPLANALPQCRDPPRSLPGPVASAVRLKFVYPVQGGTATTCETKKVQKGKTGNKQKFLQIPLNSTLSRSGPCPRLCTARHDPYMPIACSRLRIGTKVVTLPRHVMRDSDHSTGNKCILPLGVQFLESLCSPRPTRFLVRYAFCGCSLFWNSLHASMACFFGNT